MNNKATRIGVALLFIILFVTIGWLWYGGAFKAVRVEKKDQYNFTIYGEAYQGSLKEKTLANLFTKYEELSDDTSLYVMVCYEGLPTKENKYTTKLYIGLNKSTLGARAQEVNWKKVYTARHHSSYLMNKAQTSIFNTAEKDAVKLDLSQMLEVYYTQEDIRVVVPVL